jgi:hypothetical protein
VIVGVAGVEREPVGDRRRGYQHIERAGGRLPAGSTERRRDLAERVGGGSIERQWIEVRLGLLNARKAAWSSVTSGPTDSTASVPTPPLAKVGPFCPCATDSLFRTLTLPTFRQRPWTP